VIRSFCDRETESILRARLGGGIRNKAARGELRRGLPVGFVWGEKDGEVRVRSALHHAKPECDLLPRL